MRPLPLAMLLCVMLSAASAGADEPPPVRRLLPTHVIPTADEIANPQLYHPRPTTQYVPPAIYGPPPPTGAVRPGEFEPMDAVLLALVNYGAQFDTMWAKMVAAWHTAGHTYIIADATMQDAIAPLLYAEGVSEDEYSFLNYSLDSIWIRDFGPEFAVEEGGTRHVIDFNYGSDRPHDDVIPIWVGAGDWIAQDGEGLEVHGSLHGLSGGNVMSDGAGTCFFSDIVFGYEKPGGWTDGDVEDEMRDYLGCEQIIVLKPICHDGTGHIDLYAKLVGPTSILLAEFPADTHFDGSQYEASTGFCGDHYPNDRLDMEDNLATIEATTNLADEPWQVTRIVAPEPYDGLWGWTYRSYLNSQMMNDVIAMPSYYEPRNDETVDELLAMEDAAIAAYETAAPGVTVFPIDADHIIPYFGAMHCIAHEIPAEEGWEPPAEYCGDSLISGDEECDGKWLDGATCTDLGFESGTLSCDEHCALDTSDCESGADADSDADSDADGDVDADAGPADADDSDGSGCGCSAVGGRTAFGLWGLLLG